MASVPKVGQAAPAPPQPRTLEELGVGVDVVDQLLIKTLYTGEATGHDLSGRLRIPFAILERVVERARAEQLIEVRGAGGTGAASYRYAVTDLGRDRGRQYLDMNGYVGAVPVPLATYIASVHSQAKARAYIGADRLQHGFSDLIVEDSLLEKIGPAVNGGKAIFLHGPAGNGKTVIAQGIGHALGGAMYIPYAVAIDGHIITMFDPITHDTLETEVDADTNDRVVNTAPRDRRWVRIRRPVIVVGGELTLDMLDLTFNPIAKFYEAPVQLKANGGVLLVDDFGRQRMRPEDLLNRWIVPLESRVDYLTLHTGRKFQVPFDVLLLFATNLNPAALADDAFLRRIPYKIGVGDPSLEQFTRIFELNCQRRAVPFHEPIVDYLYRRHYTRAGRSLRACHPRDLLDQVVALCQYRGLPPIITRELLDAACQAYFVDNELPPVASAKTDAESPLELQ